ncbi:MAG: hypothetical protein ABR555_09710 [Pyrinomonadaceae bacterium]
MTDEHTSRELLRHTVATLAYRGAKAVRGADDQFGQFVIDSSARTPLHILAHIGDLLDWALAIAKGEQIWRDAKGESWPTEIVRFHTTLAAFDDYLASDAQLHASAEELFQGPIADALTHVGQIALLRRLANVPVRGENYFVADIQSGAVGPDQPQPRREFD